MWRAAFSYISVFVRTKINYYGDRLLMCCLLILPEYILFQLQIWHAVLFSNYIVYFKAENTGRLFWYLYFNMELDDDYIIVYDFNRLRNLCFLRPPDADFEIGGKRFIIDGGQVQNCKFSEAGGHLFIKK